ncbi:histone-lysine N-methyltransferase SETMAR [Trichonephila clavipes]|nr:histone-lysine N-methyltransferase SETMAR [Trichonephila clavipes]
MTLLRTQVEANPCQTIEELSNYLNQPWLTIQEHLQQIGKTSREGVWIPHNLPEKKTELTDLRHATYCFNGTIQNRFWIAAHEKWVLYDNPKR